MPIPSTISYKYLVLDDDNNLHVALPIVSGNETINLDNTCQTERASEQFLLSMQPGVLNATQELTNYQTRLTNILPTSERNMQNTINSILSQIDFYIIVINKFDVNNFYRTVRRNRNAAIATIINKKSNAAAIRLSSVAFPHHNYLYFCNDDSDPSNQQLITENCYLFSLKVVGYATNARYNINTIEEFKNAQEVNGGIDRGIGAIQLRDGFATRFVDYIVSSPQIHSPATSVGSLIIQSALEYHRTHAEEININTAEGEINLINLLNRLAQEHGVRNIDFANLSFMGETVSISSIARHYGEIQLDFEEVIRGFIFMSKIDEKYDSPFKKYDNAQLNEQNFKNQLNYADRMNLFTQFFFAQLNSYCHFNNLLPYSPNRQPINFGAILEVQTAQSEGTFSEQIASIVIDSIYDINQAAEDTLLEFVNNNYDLFYLYQPLTTEQCNEFKKILKINLICIQDDSNHLDEFLLLDRKICGDVFIKSSNICISLSQFISEHLIFEQRFNYPYNLGRLNLNANEISFFRSMSDNRHKMIQAISYLAANPNYESMQQQSLAMRRQQEAAAAEQARQNPANSISQLQQQIDALSDGPERMRLRQELRRCRVS